jgi:glucose/mannose-6-phosphate isomerase
MERVVVCGMGGSAIGAEFAAVWLAPQRSRLVVHRTYGVPEWADDMSFFVFSSYSGNTEETLDAFEASRREFPARACITTGGALAERARAEGVPIFEVPGGLQPRAALGHSLTALLILVHEAQLCYVDPVPELEAAAAKLQDGARRCAPETPTEQNPAKQLAQRLHGRLPCIYTGSGVLQPVGVRWRGQIDENAKQLALHNVFPELDHNEIMAWHGLPEVRRHVHMLVLRDREDHERVRLRMQITADILAGRVAGIEWIDVAGETRLERMLSASHFADWTSVYLAFLNEVDPTPVREIELLKQRLAQQ